MRRQRRDERQRGGSETAGRPAPPRRWPGLAAPLALGLLLPLLPSAGARAMLIASNVVEVTTAQGSIALASRVYDEDGGDPSRWRFEYELTGDYEPEPGSTNGISSLQILFAGLLPSVADQTAPSGWLVDCCLTGPPFGVGFDRPNGAGAGIGPGGSALFSFTVPPGTPFTDDPSGSFAGSHLLDVPVDFVELVDDTSGRGPIVPVPEPASLPLAALGLAGLARIARRRR